MAVAPAAEYGYPLSLGQAAIPWASEALYENIPPPHQDPAGHGAHALASFGKYVPAAQVYSGITQVFCCPNSANNAVRKSSFWATSQAQSLAQDDSAFACVSCLFDKAVFAGFTVTLEPPERV